MISNTEQQPVHVCLRCGYTWRGRSMNLELGRRKPLECPQCQRRDWDQPKKG